MGKIAKALKKIEKISSPEKMMEIANEVKSYKVWRKVMEKINLRSMDKERVIDLVFMGSLYFQNYADYGIKKGYWPKRSKSKFIPLEK